MRKTDSDQVSDFSEVFDFRRALEKSYPIEVSHAFSEPVDGQKNPGQGEPAAPPARPQTAFDFDDCPSLRGGR